MRGKLDDHHMTSNTSHMTIYLGNVDELTVGCDLNTC